MPRKLLIDTDPGIDDAVALTLALLDPQLDVLAVTATAGNVEPELATRNVQVVIEQLDPPKWPRIGTALPAPPATDWPAGADRRSSKESPYAKHLHGADGLGEADFQVAELHHLHASDRLIVDLVRASPYEVTILALGPLTNLANAFRRDPELPRLLRQLVIMGGSVAVGGNITPAAEFNVYHDPLAAREVFRAPVPKLLVPLDVTQRLTFTFDHFDCLPGSDTRAGRFLRRILPFAFRAHHQHLGRESIYLHDVVALCALVRPELFQTRPMVGEVELAGELTLGATVFDRRCASKWQTNLEVALDLDVAGVTSYLSACFSVGE